MWNEKYVVRICTESNGFSGGDVSQPVDIFVDGGAEHHSLNLIVTVLDNFFYF